MSDCPFHKPSCEYGQCVGCKGSVCDGPLEIGGEPYQCCLAGTGYGDHASKYDDSNFECWTNCEMPPN